MREKSFEEKRLDGLRSSFTDPTAAIIGGTCGVCGQYDPNATRGRNDILYCGQCVDPETDLSLEIVVERSAPKRKGRGGA